MQYKINQPIIVRYLELDKASGLTDLILTPTNPNGIDQTPIIFTDIGSGLYSVIFTPNATGWWNVRVSSASKPKNIYSKSYFVGTEFTTYPTQEDGNLANIKTKTDNLDILLSSRVAETTFTGRVGEVQASPTQYTILGRLKDLWDKLNDLFTNGTGKIKLWDGTNQTIIDSAGHILVAGKNAVGNIPASNPITISGVDTSGKKRHLLTDSNGRLQVANATSGSVLNIPIQIGMKHFFTAVNSGEWQEVMEYIVPDGYDLSCIMFDAWSTFANERTRAVFKKNLGSFVCSTNSFIDGDSFTSPQYGARMYVYVTTQIGSGGNDVITITYTNQAGTTGRTGTVTIPKNSLVGTRLEVLLQTGDCGVLDITNVTHSQTGQAGAFNIEGTVGLFYLILASANVGYTSPAPPIGAIVVPEGEKVYIQYKASTAVSTERRLNLTATLVPR